jgi:hypothetical protein
MEYSSHIKISSKACEGVEFTILRLTWWRRQVLRERQGAILERGQGLQEKMAPLREEYRAAAAAAKESGGPIAFDEAKLKELLRLIGETQRIDRQELTPIAVEFALVGIEGLKIDGQAADFKLLRECGPDPLYEEIAQVVGEQLGLSPGEQENLESPSISAAVVDGSAGSGSAVRAGKLVTISGGDAASFTGPASASVPAIA